MSSQTPNEPRALPHAGRPRGAAWRALQAEGIEWEAQVLIGSGEKTLSARLVVTTERLAFARGGDVVLDIDRRWLTRPPYLNGDGTINLAIDTGSGHRERLQFGARDGRAIATDFVNLLTHGPEAIAEAPMEARFSRVPERKRSSLPADPAFPTELVPAAGEHTYSRDVIDATTMQVLDPTDFPPLTEAASPTTNLRNAPEGGRGSSDPITISTLANQNHRSGQWSLAPMANTVPATQGISRAGWAFRLSGLVLLLALAAAFGTDRLPHIPGMPSRDTFIAAPNTNAATEQALAQVVATATSTEPSMSEQATTAAEQTAVALGVGSEAAFLTPTATLAPAEPTETATETLTAGEAQGGYLPAEEPTETATLAPTETETLVPTDMPTETSVPVDTATLEPTIAEPTATETVIAEDTATETALPEATATETVIVETATETLIPTETTVPSATEVPTETATETATEIPTPSNTPTPGFAGQDQTVAKAGDPDQVFATGAFRYTIEFAERGTEIPTLELNAVAGQDWVVVVLYARNWSTEPATLNMADFQLLVSGDFGWQFIGMDAASTQIGQFLGFDPILQPTDLTSIKDGQGIRLALVYSIPAGSTGMELIDDTSGLNLGESLASGGDVTALGKAPVAPDLITATVTQIIDGRTIVVQDAEGYTATVQYLGIVVPTGTECYAAESTQMNSDITLGATVYLERQYRDHVSGESDVLARDVWIDNQQGGLVLVAAWMASEGAAVASPTNQDTRFAGWIQAAAGAAEANTYGFWATCGDEPVAPEANTTDTTATSATLPVDPLVENDS